jgi:hypothetical protein
MFEWPYFPGAISGALLFFAGLTAYRCWRELRSTQGAGFWALAAIGLAWLALDEWFAIHEAVAESLFPNLGIVNHPDDVIILGYAVTAAVIGGLFWRQVTAEARAFRWLCGAAAATAIAGGLDAFGGAEFWLSAVSEEIAEISAGAMALLAMRARLAAARGGEGNRDARPALPHAEPRSEWRETPTPR